MMKLMKFTPIEVKKITVGYSKKIFVRFKKTFNQWKEVNLNKEHEEDLDDFIKQVNYSFQRRYTEIETKIKEYNKDLKMLNDTIIFMGKDQDQYSPSMKRYFRNRGYLDIENTKGGK